MPINALSHIVLGASLAFAVGCSSGGPGTAGSGSTASSGAGTDPNGSAAATGDQASGGGAASGSGNGAGGGAAAGAPSGTLFHISAGRLVAYDVAAKKEISTSLPTRTSGLAYGDGVFTEVETPDLENVIVHVHTFENSQFKHGTMPQFTVNGNVRSGAVPSPDGARFALVVAESGGLGEPFVPYLGIYDLNVTRVAHLAGFGAPVWSDAHHVVAPAEGGIYAIDLSAGTSRRIGPAMTAVGDLALSPDGKTLAFMRENAVWRMDLDGTHLTQLTLQDSSHFNPAWSPDGAALAVEYGVCSYTSEARVKIISATATQQRITDAPTLAGAFSCDTMKWM